MIILGIDPGEKSSGVVLFDSKANRVLDSYSDFDNRGLAVWLGANDGVWNLPNGGSYEADCVVCEKPTAMGQPLSKNLVETIHWTGAMWWSWIDGDPKHWVWITRNEVKVAICGKCQGVKDAHVLCGVQERFGGKDKCKGTKKEPGPCYGVSGHAWQALAAVVACLGPTDAILAAAESERIMIGG